MNFISSTQIAIKIIAIFQYNLHKQHSNNQLRNRRESFDTPLAIVNLLTNVRGASLYLKRYIICNFLLVAVGISVISCEFY